MPTPGQMNAAQGASIPPELLAQMNEQRRGGAIMGGGPQVMTQHEGVLAARVAELQALDDGLLMVRIQIDLCSVREYVDAVGLVKRRIGALA